MTEAAVDLGSRRDVHGICTRCGVLAAGGASVTYSAGPVLSTICLAALVEPPEGELTGVVGGEFVLIAISCLLMSR